MYFVKKGQDKKIKSTIAMNLPVPTLRILKGGPPGAQLKGTAHPANSYEAFESEVQDNPSTQLCT
jgi:hypothetical protein